MTSINHHYTLYVGIGREHVLYVINAVNEFINIMVIKHKFITCYKFYNQHKFMNIIKFYNIINL